MGYGLAFLFGIYITDMDVMGYSWRSTYILAGLPGLVLSPILLVLHDPRPEDADTRVRKVSYIRKLSCIIAPDNKTVQQSYTRRLSLVIDPSDSETSVNNNNNNSSTKLTTPSYISLVMTAFSSPVMITLFLAASTRHTGKHHKIFLLGMMLSSF